MSKAAVSLALNGKSGVSEETRKRILGIVQETGYIPRSMVKANQIYNTTKYFRFLACIKSDVVSPKYPTAPFFLELIHHIEENCRSLGYSLTFSSVKRATFREEIEKLEKKHPSNGIILLGTNLSSEEVQSVMNCQPKLIVLDACFNILNIDCVVMNNVQGAHTAVAHLIALGHRRIGYVESHTYISNFESRKKGFLDALNEKEITISAKDFFLVTPEIDIVQKEVKQIIIKRNKDLPTALFCENDYIAIGVIKALNEINIKVPDDISVIGFDNIPQATIISPELTTIHVYKDEMAALAVRRLDEIIENSDLPSIKLIIDTRLVERKSCQKATMSSTLIGSS